MAVNTAALKSFAPAMRRQLLEAVGRKLDLLLNSQTPDTLSTYATQIAELREQEAENREQLLERVAYTWFNRLCALRYLDAKGWHPFGCKVLMPAAEGETQPELLKLMRAGNLPAELRGHTNESRLHGLLDGLIQPAIGGADPQGEVYRELVLATCRLYHELLPNLFEGLDDATELLLPDDLLTEGSIAGQFRSEISDDDCQDVEIIGWLYQFYISDKKDDVMARKKAVPPEDIPAVTQLFTPHWIVRYLVENSLGRLWLLNRPGSKIRDHMPYYIEVETEPDFLVINNPEEIKLVDPACGSGHMLTYAFDLLFLIYEEEGYAPSAIPGLILRHNLHGLEICPRAAQLAELALVFKAREKSRRFFQSEQLARPGIIGLQEVRFKDSELNDYVEKLDLGQLLDPDLFSLLRQFEDAKSFGSLIQPCLDEQTLAEVRITIEAEGQDLEIFLQKTHLKVLRVLKQAESLTQRYHVAVANPPYMGSANFNPSLKRLAKGSFPQAKKNLFSMFIHRNQALLRPKGLSAMITLQDWMFISSFNAFRENLFQGAAAASVIHLGPRAFDSISGEIVQAVAFVLVRNGNQETKGVFYDLVTGRNEQDKEEMFLDKRNRFFVSAADILSVTGAPVAYWISRRVRTIFQSIGPLRDFVAIRAGMATGDNEKFVRLWTEVSYGKLATSMQSKEELWSSNSFKWIPFNKGGEFKKWFGNNLHVISYDRASYALLKRSGNQCPSEEFYFRQNLTWSDVTSASFGVRLTPQGSVFSSVGNSVFGDEDKLFIVGCFLCSKIADSFLRILNPTLHCNPGEVGALPFEISLVQSQSGQLRDCFTTACQISRDDWDSFETSWDFRDQPLLRQGLKGVTMETSWRSWEEQCKSAVRRMQGLETENNRFFITAYGLDGELEPDVAENQITLARADNRKDIAAFLSYATGCMMGRYSLDQPGLILADSRDSQAEQLAAYEGKVGKPLGEVQFKPDPDGIIPVLDGEWFEDDIVARTREFLAVTFPESSVAENLRFIEESLGKDIRKYFCSEFYKDHLQTYKKRPIYWMVQSPKKGFACLIYLHRYTKDTLNQVLNNYFRPYLQKLEARLAQLGLDQLNDDLPARERTAARKEAEKITKVLKECQAWEQDALLPLAQQRIELDLDDGVKVNYLKLQDVLATIPGLAAKED